MSEKEQSVSANSADTQTIKKTDDNSAQQGRPSAVTGSSRKFPGKLLVALLFIIMLVGIAANFYHAVEQQKAIQVLFEQQNSFVQGLSDSAETVALQQTRQDLLSQQLLQLEAIISEQNSSIERLGNELISTRLRIEDNGPANNQIILLAEAESLLRIAQQRLVVSRDIRSGIALYLSVDDILQQIDDPAVFSVRDILSRELLALRSMEEKDVQGLYLRLGSLVQSLDDFEVVNAPLRMPEQEAGNETQEQGLIDSMLGKIGSAFVVTHHEQPVQPLLSSAQGYMIRQNIRLQLEQARLALLQQEPEAYRVSLLQASMDIERFLQAQGNSKQILLETIEELGRVSVVQEIPPVGNTLIALRQLNAAVQTSNGSLPASGDQPQ